MYWRVLLCARPQMERKCCRCCNVLGRAGVCAHHALEIFAQLQGYSPKACHCINLMRISGYI